MVAELKEVCLRRVANGKCEPIVVDAHVIAIYLQSSFGFMLLAQYRNGVSENETAILSIKEVT